MFFDADLFVLPTSFGKLRDGGCRGAGSWSAGPDNHGRSVVDAAREGCGWWVPPTVDGIADGLRRATSLDSETLQCMGEKGRCLVLKEFSWDRVASLMLWTYEDVLRHGPVSAKTRICSSPSTSNPRSAEYGDVFRWCSDELTQLFNLTISSIPNLEQFLANEYSWAQRVSWRCLRSTVARRAISRCNRRGAAQSHQALGGASGAFGESLPSRGATGPHRDFARSQGPFGWTNSCGWRCGHTGGPASVPAPPTAPALHKSVANLLPKESAPPGK